MNEEYKSTTEQDTTQTTESHASHTHDNATTQAHATVSALPSAQEAISMAKKLFADTSKSITEIYKDYKSKRTSDGDK